MLSVISKRLLRKALDMFADLQKDEKKFETFSQNFGRYLKVGVIEVRLRGTTRTPALTPALSPTPTTRP